MISGLFISPSTPFQSHRNKAVAGVIEKLLTTKEEPIEFFVGGIGLLVQICGDSQDMQSLRTDFKLSKGIFEESSEVWTGDYRTINNGTSGSTNVQGYLV